MEAFIAMYSRSGLALFDLIIRLSFFGVMGAENDLVVECTIFNSFSRETKLSFFLGVNLEAIRADLRRSSMLEEDLLCFFSLRSLLLLLKIKLLSILSLLLLLLLLLLFSLSSGEAEIKEINGDEETQEVFDGSLT
ncbi:GSCOCG00008908001-RA-CDS [Cotesia congregata]|nr:GSCOCG00008908001-RA-CDS [Cotesia congregata]